MSAIILNCYPSCCRRRVQFAIVNLLQLEVAKAVEWKHTETCKTKTLSLNKFFNFLLQINDI
jgi:hypothetical protein